MAVSKSINVLLRDLAVSSDKLLDLGVIRTDSFFGEIAEYIACHHFNLKLTRKVSRGVDAIDSDGKRYQIKSRVLSNGKFIYSGKGLENSLFDFLIVIFFDEHFKLAKIVKIPCKECIEGKVRLNCSSLPPSALLIDGLKIKIPAQQKKAIEQFVSLYAKLQNTAIIRSGRIVGDIGEYYAAKKLGLKLADNKCEKGYDAVDEKGILYEIKTRRVYESERRVSKVRRLNNLHGKNAKYLVVVVLDREFQCAGMWKVPIINILNPKEAKLSLVNNTKGTVTIIKSKISWLKGDSPILKTVRQEEKFKQQTLPRQKLNSRPAKKLKPKKILSEKKVSYLEGSFINNDQNKKIQPVEKMSKLLWWQIIGLLWIIYQCIKYLQSL